jgi:hypothetical protein
MMHRQVSPYGQRPDVVGTSARLHIAGCHRAADFEGGTVAELPSQKRQRTSESPQGRWTMR